MIKDNSASGVFRRCVDDPKSSAARFYENCVYDACANSDGGDVDAAVCRSIEAFATACKDLGHVSNWREELGTCSA